MNRLPLCCLALLAVSGTSRAQNQTAITAHLLKPTASNASPSGFLAVRIMRGEHQYTVKFNTPVSCIPKDKAQQLETGLLQEKIKGFQLDPSRCFFHADTPSIGPLLLFVGEPLEPDPGHAVVIGFNESGAPVTFFERQSFDVIELLSKEPESDSVRIAGKSTTSEAMGCVLPRPESPQAATYDPFAVYELRAGTPPRYLAAASRQYNFEHYVWLGPHSREDYAVVTGVPGHRKPLAVKARDLDNYLKCKP